ncbi:hypothetical protein V8G54_015810 [Vigna mungo]|uniref:Uncharacterized protein n=1 Tax=Vigna mungo TaxID=3915 RepID=A0AAQ3NJ54_VIGMU
MYNVRRSCRSLLTSVNFCPCFFYDLHYFFHTLAWLVLLCFLVTPSFSLNYLPRQVLPKPKVLFYLRHGDPLSTRMKIIQITNTLQLLQNKSLEHTWKNISHKQNGEMFYINDILITC